MIASFPMYDRPEAQAANDALWAGVRARLGYGPAALDRQMFYMDTWAAPDLVLGQICNLPLAKLHRDRLVVLGSGDHRLKDTPAGFFHSLFVVRKADAPRGLAPAVLGRFAYNDALSQSGWAAPLARITAQGLQFRDTLHTGSHAASIDAVAHGRADLAAIDAVTWHQHLKWDPLVEDLAVIGRTGLSPAQSFVTTAAHDADALRLALKGAIADLTPDHKDALCLYGMVRLPDAAFEIAVPNAPASPLHSPAI